MNEAPSYKELKDNRYFWIELTPYVAGFNETVDENMLEGPFSSNFYYESAITAIQEDSFFPFEDMRLDVIEREESVIKSITEKYPFGFIQFFNEEDASITLICRDKLFSKMATTLHMVRDKEIEFFVTLPQLPSELPSVYPVLNYQFRIRSERSIE